MLVTHDVAVYSAHLPLDVHPEIGNNKLLAAHLGLMPSAGFAPYQSIEVGLSGSSDVPVVAFATFYITGWDGAPSQCVSTKNEPPPPNSDSKGNSSNLWGQFISFETNGDPSGIKCPGNSVTPCVAALVR